MKTQTENSEITSRRTFGKFIVAAFAALPIGALVERASAQSSKRKSQVRILQSSPITIGGGGSVGIHFNSNYYKRIPHTNLFKNTVGDMLHKLWVTDRFGANRDRTPASSRCRIVMHCERFDASGNPIPDTDSPITLYGRPLAIEFNPDDYPYGIPTGGQDPIYYHADRKITRDIEVWLGSVAQPSFPPPTGGTFSIKVVNSY
ncbi:MAG: hypothetical protein ABR501_02340 [Pyrinomonadaceae bacterium]